MIDKIQPSRRQFLRNTSLAALSLPFMESMDFKTKASLLDCPITTLDFFGEGPFYTNNPPMIENGQLVSDTEEGERMVILGRVFNQDCTQIIPNTLIDIWHANDAGAYDNEGFNLRGTTVSNNQGYYFFETIKPGKYLNGNQFRPSHIHLKITAPGSETLTTQLYFLGDEEIDKDAAASIKSGQFDASSRIIALKMNNDAKLEGTWDIIINGSGTTSADNLHIDKGMVYSVYPNPFSNIVKVRYGIFKTASVTLLVHDLLGREVATLEETNLTPQKYEAIWNPPLHLDSGHYFISLRINGQEVHYMKVIKE